MLKNLKAKWIAALRSGDYKQGQGSMVVVGDDGPSYCCLGVLAEIDNPGWLSAEVSGSVPYGKFKLSSVQRWHLVGMNDTEGKSFSEIADWIEKNIPDDEED